VPDDPCYAYHLGLAAHRQGDLDLAIRSYHVARREENEFASRAAYPMALAQLQRGEDPSSQTVWSALSDQERAMLSQASAFGRRPYVLSSDAPALWHGMVALDCGSQEQAQSLLEQALQDSASALEKGIGHYYLGVLAAQEDDWAETGRRWNAARVAGLKSEWLKANLGELYHRLAEDRLQGDDVEGALEAATESARHKPDDKRLGDLLSQAYQRQAYQAASDGDWEKALERWTEAVAVGGSSFRLAYNLALAYEQTEDFVAAGQAWREALRRRPRKASHPDAISDEQVSRLWRRAAIAYHKAGEYEKAADVYRQALKWNPSDLETRMVLAESLLNDGRVVAAQNELNRILERDPDNIPALLRIGEAIAESGQWYQRIAAPRYWNRVLELDPDNASARQLLADYFQDDAENLVSWGNYRLAVEKYRQALQYQPQNARVLAALGRCYLEMDDLKSAQSFIEQAQSIAPRDLEVYDEIINAWIWQGDADRAWAAMSQAEATIETIPFAFYIMQASHCIESDYDELVYPWLERAVEKAPPGEPVFTAVGEMAVMAGASEIAREYLERAVEARQEIGQAYLMLGILSATADHDLDAANRYWNRAERVARKERDAELDERIDMARAMFSAPFGLFDLLMRAPFLPPGIDLDGFPFDFFDEEDDDDDYY
jgi:tetratricopeptide (TPR) repeat protein